MIAYRQGDVVVVKATAIPKTATPLAHRVLAEGEMTGHKHQITEGEAILYLHGGTMFLKVESKVARLTHEEHGPITLPEGKYRITIQREYEPSGWRNVQD